ncbi:MAG: N-acetylmuramic acid 6-phosphate etherase, partial [Planctomycetota bacterium]|nr:N-acetylmuramic acid 6-phosphate etherase [Planctomycetota bacterium]
MSAQPHKPALDRAQLPTECPLAESESLSELDTKKALALCARADAAAASAVQRAADEIASVVDLVATRLAEGGRLFYVGAGTSGRLGVLDAAECPPTFHSSPEQVQALIAGGDGALTRAVEGAEDDEQAAGRELTARGLGPADVVIAISAGGTTPYAHGALAAARAAGAASVFLACVPFEAAPDRADLSLRLETGPEILTGSTRLKAGTATKMVLNTISTLTMARLGKIHGNRMVDVATGANDKLRDRGLRLVCELADVDRSRAGQLLDAAGGRVKTAVVMGRCGLERAAAEERLAAADGFLGSALATA